MTRPTLTRTAAFAALVVMTGLLSTGPASPADPSYPIAAAEVGVLGDGATQFVPIGVGKTVVINLPRDAKDVLVADPKIANAVVRTSRRAYLIGVQDGWQTCSDAAERDRKEALERGREGGGDRG